MSNSLPQTATARCRSVAEAHPDIVSWPSRQADLGAGLMVERALPLRQHRMVGPWCFFDHFGPLSFDDRKVMDVAPHPHIGLQTVSWLFAGEVLHNDSLGNEGLVRPGELNLMTAGNGIAHSEETPPHHSGHLHGLQLWTALPDAVRNSAPAFDHYRELPLLEPGGGSVQIFMGKLAGLQSPARAFSELVGAELVIEAAGCMRLPLDPGWEHALIIIDGAAELDGQRLEPKAMHYLGTARDGLQLHAAETTRAILIGGKPFDEAIVMWWNFVARTPEEIGQARADWQAGRRFGEVGAYRGQRLDAPPLVGRPVARGPK